MSLSPKTQLKKRIKEDPGILSIICPANWRHSLQETVNVYHYYRRVPTFEGLPGVLGNKGTLAKYRREQGNISQCLGRGEQNSKNYNTKTFWESVGTWEHRAILEGNKGTRTPLGDPHFRNLTVWIKHRTSMIEAMKLDWLNFQGKVVDGPDLLFKPVASGPRAIRWGQVRLKFSLGWDIVAYIRLPTIVQRNKLVSVLHFTDNAKFYHYYRRVPTFGGSSELYGLNKALYLHDRGYVLRLGSFSRKGRRRARLTV